MTESKSTLPGLQCHTGDPGLYRTIAWWWPDPRQAHPAKREFWHGLTQAGTALRRVMAVKSLPADARTHSLRALQSVLQTAWEALDANVTDEEGRDTHVDLGGEA